MNARPADPSSAGRCLACCPHNIHADARRPHRRVIATGTAIVHVASHESLRMRLVGRNFRRRSSLGFEVLHLCEVRVRAEGVTGLEASARISRDSTGEGRHFDPVAREADLDRTAAASVSRYAMRGVSAFPSWTATPDQTQSRASTQRRARCRSTPPRCGVAGIRQVWRRATA
jgi:hypothetical protein